MSVSEISTLIEKKIAALDLGFTETTEGTIVSVKDGILEIVGLSTIGLGEMIALSNGEHAVAMNLSQDHVGAVGLGKMHGVSSGQIVRATGKLLSVPTGEALLGRVVDAMGRPIDGGAKIQTSTTSPIEKIAPGVIEREGVNEPLQTGILAIDSMVPVGKGQRELIIGDRQTGKSTVAIDAIINQKDTGVKCVYVAMGQKASTVANIVRTLADHGALDHTIVVAANASDPASMQYIAPYAGCAMAEYFRDKGEDALIVYDDLSKQAWAYRQIALLLRRPPGREAYPGDVFYLHSRLLERAAKVNADYVSKQTGGKVKNKTGSLTALPIIETQAGDLSAFVPTNVISITDGQIFLETGLFNAGIRPAIDSGASVSRVGGAAQTPIMKKLGGKVRLSLAQYRELEAFSQFASDLDAATRKQLERGKRLTALLKQRPHQAQSVAQMSLLLFAANEGFLDDVEVEHIPDFAQGVLEFAHAKEAKLMSSVNASGQFDDKTSKAFSTLLTTYKKQR
jgi:F-type H+-transporting ATPase subunit alpha